MKVELNHLPDIFSQKGYHKTFSIYYVNGDRDIRYGSLRTLMSNLELTCKTKSIKAEKFTLETFVNGTIGTPRIKCQFEVAHDEKAGFQVYRMKMTSLKLGWPEVRVRNIETNDRIPGEFMISSMFPRQKRRIENRPGRRFRP